MLIWGTKVSKTQFFGYAVALSGMLYYKLGAEQLKQYFSNAGRSWAEFGVQRPVARKLVVFGLVIITMILLLGGIAPTYAPNQTKSLTKYFSGFGSS